MSHQSIYQTVFILLILFYIMTPSSPTSPSVTTMASSSPLIQSRQRTSSSSSEDAHSKSTRRRSLGMTMGVADVASLFIKMRRSSDRVKSAKSSHIISSSGEIPVSHPGAQEAVKCSRREHLSVHEVFYCIGAVNVSTLLRAVRGSLIETTEMLGGNVLLDEQWECEICPKNRTNGTFKVHIRYSADAARADTPVDPHRPVALDRAKGVPGLMTILRRQE
ncbi:hypothetical protein VKT23_018376 [Stygiomarasmius scandens]|uniref:Uncharacterized protein n=1 Tax=Marasmiellus scandens TaxID=2682957 RepID=A0ABR1ITY8_9AGAR